MYECDDRLFVRPQHLHRPAIKQFKRSPPHSGLHPHSHLQPYSRILHRVWFYAPSASQWHYWHASVIDAVLTPSSLLVFVRQASHSSLLALPTRAPFRYTHLSIFFVIRRATVARSSHSEHDCFYPSPFRHFDISTFNSTCLLWHRNVQVGIHTSFTPFGKHPIDINN